MITSIFNKSKPINFTIVFFITFLAFIVLNIKRIEESITATFLLKQAFLFFVCYVSILGLSFIVGKNSLTKKSNYEIVLYSLFLLAIPQTVGNPDIIYANFFVLLGYRRIISLRSQISVNKKLFDAAFWFGIAALFYFWAILFFLLIVISLLLYTDNNIKHWLIPFTGLLAVFLISVCLSIIWYDSFFEIFDSLPEVSYNFSNYNSIQYLIIITMLFSFGVWASIFYIKNIKQKKKVLRPSYYVVLFAVLIGFLIIVFAPNKNGSEFLFLFAPLAIIIANYIEIIQERWFKELFLSIIIIAPFVILLL
ncbi:DUF6427 family protein [Jejuia spongiicola]|uniref:DUF6427 family protein n=1 Tax=Jejuia spongiicola TaxID=2942207 RepID=A0ABT0QAY0_9FLAO|nr:MULTISPECIES: DUF6427 family protein [Flavobacteriaceae]MCL6293404.1 DUF6427 family protein [Jejuia spongiicola]PIA79032.1 hypothetical protein BFR04_05790 [Gaetbulibacter sp. 4G1]